MMESGTANGLEEWQQRELIAASNLCTQFRILHRSAERGNVGEEAVVQIVHGFAAAIATGGIQVAHKSRQNQRNTGCLDGVAGMFQSRLVLQTALHEPLQPYS